MAWDFSTDPEFQEHLDWMDAFVKEEIRPFEVVDLPFDQMMRAMEPLQQQVKDRGLWAAHLDRELGGQGSGQVKLRRKHQILPQTPPAPLDVCAPAPDSGRTGTNS